MASQEIIFIERLREQGVPCHISKEQEQLIDLKKELQALETAKYDRKPTSAKAKPKLKAPMPDF